MKDSIERFQDYETFVKEAKEYHTNVNSRYADRVLHHEFLIKEDNILRCHLCGSHDMDTLFNCYICKPCYIKALQRSKNMTKEEAEKIVENKINHKKSLYEDTLKKYPTTAAIIEYAESHGLMHKQVDDIIRIMRDDGLDVKNLKVYPMVKEVVDKMEDLPF